MENQILIIGGTGNTGMPLVDLLVGSDARYQVLVRSDQNEAALAARGVPTVRGELGDWPVIAERLNGVDTVFLLSSPTPDMLELHKRVIDLSVEAGVRKIVRLSAEPARRPEGMALYEQHAAADSHLMASGLEYVILRPHYFMQNIPQMHAMFIQEKHMFAQYLGDAKIPMVDTRDIAKAALACLTSDAHNGQIHTITGPRAISFYDVAEEYSKALGHKIQYLSLTYEDQKAGFEGFGMPQWTVKTVMTLFKQWVDQEVQPVSEDYQRITNVAATDIRQFVADFAVPVAETTRQSA